MKVQISVPDELMGRIDDYAEENYLSRSGLFTLSATQFLNASEVTKCVKGMSVYMRKISETGIVDDDTKRKLEDFERLAKMLTGV